MNKVIAYYRVSTDKQGERGLGMQAQQFSVENYIKANNAQLIESFNEVESGKNNNRPEFAKAKALAIKERATLLIAKLDRLARNVVFIGKLLEDDNFNFVALDMPSAGKFEFHIRAALAEEEARLISERTKAGLARSKKPLGAANPKIKAAANTKRQELVDEFLKTYEPLVGFLKMSSDKISYQQVADKLNQQGKKTRLGRDWSYMSVKRLFERLDEQTNNYGL